MHADFILCDPSTFYVEGVIELDGNFHSTAQQQKRDQRKNDALKSAGIPICRIEISELKNLEKVRAKILDVFKIEDYFLVKK